jgi:hypothetical protein
MPWELGNLDAADVFALQAVAKGVANAGQQQRALAVIQDKICRRRRMSFFPGADGHRATDFAEGKRFVGDQIERLLKMRPETSNRETPEGVPIGDDTKA